MIFSSTISILLVLLHLKATVAIINGKVAQPGQFQYQVLLKIRKDNEARICGGAIIDELHILTAWHCVEGLKPKNIEAIVGAVLFDNDPNGESYEIKKIHLHQSRTCKPGEKRCYDVAVLTVKEHITYWKTVDEIPVPETDVAPGDECVFAGWGITEKDTEEPSNELRYGYGTIYPHSYCSLRFRSLKDYEFCFKPSGRDKATIESGDSGGPFVCNGVLTGVIIRSNGDPRDPVVAINVYKLLDFISNIKDTGSCVLL